MQERGNTSNAAAVLRPETSDRILPLSGESNSRHRLGRRVTALATTAIIGIGGLAGCKPGEQQPTAHSQSRPTATAQVKAEQHTTPTKPSRPEIKANHRVPMYQWINGYEGDQFWTLPINVYPEDPDLPWTDKALNTFRAINEYYNDTRKVDKVDLAHIKNGDRLLFLEGDSAKEVRKIIAHGGNAKIEAKIAELNSAPKEKQHHITEELLDMLATWRNAQEDANSTTTQQDAITAIPRNVLPTRPSTSSGN